MSKTIINVTGKSNKTTQAINKVLELIKENKAVDFIGTSEAINELNDRVLAENFLLDGVHLSCTYDREYTSDFLNEIKSDDEVTYVIDAVNMNVDKLYDNKNSFIFI